MDRRGPSHSAPYGQACLHCFKSKCKCVPRPGGNGCERCHRLNKQCRPSESLRKRNAQKNQNSAERIAQLEGKLEGLVSLLRSVSKSSNSYNSLRKALEDNLTSHSQLGLEPPITDRILTSSNATQLPPIVGVKNVAGNLSLAPSFPLYCESLSSNLASYDSLPYEADKYLLTFRSQMLKHLAFIHIPPDTTVKELHQKRPFLLRAIIAVASPSTDQKMARGKELKQILAQDALTENQSSLDLLLGLLTYITWGWDTFLTKSATLSRLIMLAISIVGNLRLNKPLPRDVHMIGPLTPGFVDGRRKCEVDDPGQRHLEGQRAVMGCYLLSSIISSYYAQTDAMRWTSQMEEGLRAISSNKECPTDEAFALQIRLQLLAQRTLHLREQQESNYPNYITAPPPCFFYLNALRGQLQELKASISSKLESQNILMAQVHYVDLCINETGHTANSDAPLLTTTPYDSDNNQTCGFKPLECLWGSLNAIKSWLDIFFAMSPSQLSGFALPFWVQQARCIVVLYRLSTLENPAWDLKSVREVVDLLPVIDRTAEMLEQAGREHGGQAKDDIFLQVSRLVRMFRIRAATKIAPTFEGEESSWGYGDVAPGVGSNTMTLDRDDMMPLFAFVNDGFWEEFSTAFK